MPKKNKHSRPKGQHRVDLVLDVVRTDSTFELVMLPTREQAWVGRCLHCNAKIVVSQDGQTIGTLEHIMPLSSSGTDELQNLALACSSCNNQKGIHHDPYVGRGGRADQVIAALQVKRLSRWREVNENEA